MNRPIYKTALVTVCSESATYEGHLRDMYRS